NTAAGAKKDAEIAAEDARRASEKTAETTADAARDASDATKRAGEAVGEGATKAAKDASAATGAAATTMSVKSALMADRSVDSTRIDVDSDGATKIVTLRGTVPNDAQRVSAERIARAKAEGYTVVNHLTVG
ncbi:MAG: BON domain-containing protein, partial [Vicinamibacteria bacterium]|nr:BON domain-containing protein [Vicinamibacteria bacterium]